MFKKFLAAGAVLALFTQGAAAQAQTVEWRNGTAVVKAANAVCRQNGTNVGDAYNARYRHPNLNGGTGADVRARLSLFGRRSAHNFQMAGDFDNTMQPAALAVFVGGGFLTHTSTPDAYQPSLRMTKRSPGTIDATTKQIYLYFKIQDFFVNTGVLGCHIDLEVTVVQ